MLLPTGYNSSSSDLNINRTLDLRAADVSTRTKWEHYFRLVILHRKNSRLYSLQTIQIKKKIEKEKLSEVIARVLHNSNFILDLENRYFTKVGISLGLSKSKTKKSWKLSKIFKCFNKEVQTKIFVGELVMRK